MAKMPRVNKIDRVRIGQYATRQITYNGIYSRVTLAIKKDMKEEVLAKLESEFNEFNPHVFTKGNRMYVTLSKLQEFNHKIILPAMLEDFMCDILKHTIRTVKSERMEVEINELSRRLNIRKNNIIKAERTYRLTVDKDDIEMFRSKYEACSSGTAKWVHEHTVHSIHPIDGKVQYVIEFHDNTAWTEYIIDMFKDRIIIC